MAGRFFVTTPIYYLNDVPHLGTSYTMVNADALARWHRLLGDEVLFLTGTDEHGLKIARRAADNGQTPQAFVDEMSEKFKDAWKAIGIEYDDFIRTTEPRHHRSVQQFMQAIHDNGYTRLDTYQGWYCVSCEAYYQESELVEGNLCPVHRRPVEWLVEENYFFELSKFADRLVEWYEQAPDAVKPESRRNEALGFIRGGLQDISITRTSIDWGVRVPWDPKHVFYVWYDALVNYVTAIGYGEDGERFEAWWPAVTHLLGKDILRFHCVWWPAMCMAAGVDPPAHLFVHGWLLVGGEKMAKSAANQVDPAELAADVGVDPLRYELLRGVTFGGDGDFSYEGMVARYNSDLANNLGNLLARVATVVGSKCGGRAPAVPPAAESSLASVAAEIVESVRAAWERPAPNEALELTWRLIRETNAALEAAEPWKMEPGEAVEAVLGDALEVLRLVAILVSPAIPAVAEEIWDAAGAAGSRRRCRQRRPGERAASVGPVPARSPHHQGISPLPSPGCLGPVDRAGEMWTDSHCHLQDDADPPAALERAFAAGVGRVVCIGTNEDQSRRALGLAQTLGGTCPDPQSEPRPQVLATIGLHPHEASDGAGCLIRLLAELDEGAGGQSMARPGGVVVAIGECGLDYHYDHSPRPVQREAFAAQIRLAHQHRLALVIHTREAWDDTISILTAEGAPDRTIFHCFTGGPAEAERCLELGAYLSFSGIVTFKTAEDIRAAVALCPLERILVETDSPFLTPVPHRGRANEPMYVPLVGQAVAEVLGRSVAEVEAATTANAAAAFGLDG